ncbi:MAG: hypothetical protein LM582_06330 [Desulfurococcaceae archaeon]|nr:hypothetical protein [Desulfurococcaceae archaeon]
MYISGGVRFSGVLVDGLSNVFYCWVRVPGERPGVAEEFKVCRAEDFWKFSGEERSYTDFISSYTKPKGYITVSLRSRDVFRFGVFELRTKLPRYSNGPMFWFGFEAEDLFMGGVIHFMWHSDKGRLYAFAGSIVSRVEIDLTSITGVFDYSSDYHLFKIVYREGLALWYVDGNLRAIAIISSGDSRDSEIIYNAKPYAIGFVKDLPASSLPILIDIDGGDINKDYEWSIHPWSLRVFEGDPKTMVILDLYVENTDTKLRGYTVKQGSKIISAPFPGTLDDIEIVFSANGDGKLYIETYANRKWYRYREFDVGKEELYNIKLENRNTLYRVVFEALEDAVVNEAKVFMR